MAKDRIESKYVTVAPGVELHILEKGEGKPLVFIPGLTFSGEIFKNQLEYFSSEYRVIAIDPRGQGYSAKTVDGNDYLTHGRDVAGLIDALGLKDFLHKFLRVLIFITRQQACIQIAAAIYTQARLRTSLFCFLLYQLSLWWVKYRAQPEAIST